MRSLLDDSVAGVSGRIRADIPILKDLIYLDNASTSLTPEPVLDAMLDYYRSYRANVGRGVYRNAQLADQRYRDAHSKVSRFIGDDAMNVIFTRNCTESINIVAKGLQLKKGDKVVTTLVEHHSNLLPWLQLQGLGVKVEILRPDERGFIDISFYEDAIDDGTKLVATTRLSNVLGSIHPAKEISKICRDHDALFLLDGAQSVPHMPTNVKDLGCDFLCFSGHKMLSPTGIGALWVRPESGLDLSPLMIGGGMVDDVDVNASPPGWTRKKGYEGMEAGTPNIAGAIGLMAAVDYLEEVGMEDVWHHEQALTSLLYEGLLEIDGVEVYGPSCREGRGGVVSFNVRDLSPHEVALILDEAKGIMVRSGNHCCIPLMRHLGLPQGAVRASLYIYNNEGDVERLLSTVEEIARS
jgi:cysteine desulfurase/selenocysteine lyase